MLKCGFDESEFEACGDGDAQKLKREKKLLDVVEVAVDWEGGRLWSIELESQDGDAVLGMEAGMSTGNGFWGLDFSQAARVAGSIGQTSAVEETSLDILKCVVLMSTLMGNSEAIMVCSK